MRFTDGLKHKGRSTTSWWTPEDALIAALKGERLPPLERNSPPTVE